MKITVHNPELAPALTELAVALQNHSFPHQYGRMVFEARYFAERSEHIVLSGDGVTSWNRHERIVSLATGAPSMDCVRLGFRGAQS